jgi:Tc5 transposase DNA-binding domain
MPGHAKSDALKLHEERAVHDDLMSQAVKTNHHELQKPPGAPRKSMQTICRDFQDLYFNESKSVIKLSHTTMALLLVGGRTLQQANTMKSHHTEGETEIILNFITECGNQGFPLSHRRLKDHVKKILYARLGNSFRVEGLGHNWTHRFVQKHSARIKTSWATSLEEKQGQGANPHANEAWWNLLGETLKKYNIKPKNIYGVDEVGIQTQGGEQE